MQGSPGTWRWLYFRKRFHDPIRKGIKTHTLRAQRIPPGTRVACPVGLIEIKSVQKAAVGWVGLNKWKEEGCNSPDDFFAEVQSIHPELELDLSAELWLHEFHFILDHRQRNPAGINMEAVLNANP